MDINIRIAGEAGQGVASVGTIILESLCDVGYNIFSTQSYMSRIRGGLNWSDIRVADFELFGPRPTADILVALSPDALDVLASEMASGGIILSESESTGEILGIPFSKIAKDKTGNALLANAVAAGAVFGVLGGSIDGLCDFLRRHFNKKEAEVIEKNIVCAKEGFALTSRQNFAKLKLGTPLKNAPKYIGNGAAAIGLGAASSGLKFVTAYPMTPGTATFTWLAGAADQYGIAVEQAEDEIAAMNMICGAAYAGVPAMTCTSGGGFALMCEGLSLAGMMELPVLVMLAQRPGPATGLPTRTGQEDLKFTLNAGHGEFPRAIFAPGIIEECFELSRRALETAHKLQTPVILLTDQFLQDIQKNIETLPSDYRPIDRHILPSNKDYKRYAFSTNGVSPRAIPGLGEGLVVCDSDEHDESGH
ncbi:MAG: hypothetical protein A2X49_13400, partial [Lentisphaerae bacterium GWF2_52_8]